jgi:hypothetical protein
MDAQAAARLGDEIAHGFGVAAMVASPRAQAIADKSKAYYDAVRGNGGN